MTIGRLDCRICFISVCLFEGVLTSNNDRHRGTFVFIGLFSLVIFADTSHGNIDRLTDWLIGSMINY